MANLSIQKVLKILERNKNFFGSKTSKSQRMKSKKTRKSYHSLLENSRVIHVPRKIWKYIEDVSLLAEIVFTKSKIPVPYKNQVLLFQPAYKFTKFVSIEYIHIYKYSKEIDSLFPSMDDMGFMVPGKSFVPVGDVGMQICLRQGAEFPLLVSIVIMDGQPVIHFMNKELEVVNWRVVEKGVKSETGLILTAMTVLAFNVLSFISQPEIVYEWKKKRFRLPPVNGNKRRNNPASWTRSKIKRTHTVYEKKAEGEKGNYTEPQFQVEVPTHTRTLNYCQECQQFIPLRFANREECPRCKKRPFRLFQKKSVVEHFLKWKDKKVRENKKEIYLSE